MVDSAGLIQRIVVEMISFVQSLFAIHSSKVDVDHEKVKQVLTNVLRLCRNFLEVIEEKKAVPYKMAILNEFFEFIRDETKAGLVHGFTTLEHDIHRLQEYLLLITDDAIKQQIVLAQVTAGVNHFIDPHSLQPPTVIFWLKEPCTSHVMKKMQAFMLFLNKDEHVKILQHDITLLQDKNVQFLLECMQGF